MRGCESGDSITPNRSTAEAPKDVIMIGELYTSRKAVFVDMIASINNILLNEPIHAKIQVSVRRGIFFSHVNGGNGKGAYGISEFEAR